jgi:glycosyltransferase involved in cell wall biosynthesis
MDDSRSILVVFPRFGGTCNPDAGGAENRTYHLIDQLSQEFDVVLLEPDVATYPDGCDLDADRRTFRRLTPQFLTDLNPSYAWALLSILRTRDTDAVQVESLGGILVAILLTTLLRLDVPVVYGSHNVEAERVRDALNPDLPLYKRLGAPVVIPLIESLGTRFADHVIAVSDVDRATFVDRYGLDSTAVTTVRSGTAVLDEDALTPRESVRERHGIPSNHTCLVFHGTYENYANREAVELLRSEIAPVIHRNHDEVTIVLAGKGMPDDDLDHVHSVGFVEDLDSFLNAMDVAVVPLVSGGGTKLKIFDYMRVGLPIVSTAKGMEGIDVEDGREALVTDGVGDEFIEAVGTVIDDESLRTTLSSRIRELGQTRFDWEYIGRDIRAIYADQAG